MKIPLLLPLLHISPLAAAGPKVIEPVETPATAITNMPFKYPAAPAPSS